MEADEKICREEVWCMMGNDKQINKILKIAKYNFGWGRKAIFDFIIKQFPALEIIIAEDVKKGHKTSGLFAAMTSREKSHIIQILEKIERRNKCKEAQ